MKSLTLYSIEKALVELLDARDHPDMDDAGRAAIDLQVKEWLGAELTKVDGCRAFLRQCDMQIAGHKEEAARQLSLAASWESQRDYLKGCVQGAMEAAGKTKVEGRTGYFALRNAGGKQAVEITDESLIPDEFCEMVVTVRQTLWMEICDLIRREFRNTTFADWKIVRIPRKSLIEAELQKPCAACGGKGGRDAAGDLTDKRDESVVPCPACGGSGKRGVPGARLADRSTSVVVR